MSGKAADFENSVIGIAAGQLRAFVERIERLEEEKKLIAAQVKEVYAEAKGNGYCTKTLRKVVALRAKSLAERAEEEAMLDLYLDALGMRGTPLGDWAESGAADDQSGGVVSIRASGRAAKA